MSVFDDSLISVEGVDGLIPAFAPMLQDLGFIPTCGLEFVRRTGNAAMLTQLSSGRPLCISMRIMKSKGRAHDDYIRSNLSAYSMESRSGCEIIAECFSAYFSGVRTWFVREFMRDLETI